MMEMFLLFQVADRDRWKKKISKIRDLKRKRQILQQRLFEVKCVTKLNAKLLLQKEKILKRPFDKIKTFT